MTAVAVSLHQEVQRELDRLTSASGVARVPGVVVTVLDGDELHQWVSGVSGRPGGPELSGDTLFRIASVTKVYTATLVMQLVDEGRVDLDRPLLEQLPEFRLADRDEAAAVTVRQLLSHTSGVPGDWGFDGGRGDDAVTRYVASLGELRTVFPPGLMHSYSNAGYVVLGRLVEHVLGKSWDVCLQERLAKPLGLTETVTFAEDVLVRRHALGHTTKADDDAVVPVSRWGANRGSGPCGVISASPADLIAFARMHLDMGLAPDGTRVLSAEACRVMRTEQVALVPRMSCPAWGLGFQILRRDAPEVIGHGGNTAGQTGMLVLIPQRHAAVALQTNSDFGRGRCDHVLRMVLSERFGAEIPPNGEPVPVSEPTADVDQWLGVYERVDARYEIAKRGSTLEVTITPLRAYGGGDADPPQTLPLLVADDGVFLVQAPGNSSYTALVVKEWPDGRSYLHAGLRSAPRTDRPNP